MLTLAGRAGENQRKLNQKSKEKTGARESEKKKKDTIAKF